MSMRFLLDRHVSPMGWTRNACRIFKKPHVKRPRWRTKWRLDTNTKKNLWEV